MGLLSKQFSFLLGIYHGIQYTNPHSETVQSVFFVKGMVNIRLPPPHMGNIESKRLILLIGFCNGKTAWYFFLLAPLVYVWIALFPTSPSDSPLTFFQWIFFKILTIFQGREIFSGTSKLFCKTWNTIIKEIILIPRDLRAILTKLVSKW